MSLELNVILSGRSIQQVAFDRLTRVSIGRSPECEVHLDNLGISRHHAEIRDEGGVLVLHDLGSGNGTLVNGVRVTQHALNDGDLITVGKFTLAAKVLAAPGAPLARRGASDEVGALTMASTETALRAAHDAVTVHAYLRGADGAVTVLARPCYLFGRGPEVDFEVRRSWLRDLLGPFLWAALLRDERGYRLVDLSARAAVRVNGATHADARLGHEDQVEVLGRQFVYHLGRPVGA